MEEKILIKECWDNCLNWHSINNPSENIFEGRIKELNKVKDFLLRKNSGSLIISGQRGSGKTSLIIKAISDVSDRTEIFFIPLNALRMEAVFDSSDSANFLGSIHLLRQLIKSLDEKLKQETAPSPPSLKELLQKIDVTEFVWRKKFSSVAGFETGAGIRGNISGTSAVAIKADLEAIYGKKCNEETIFEKIVGGKYQEIAKINKDREILNLAISNALGPVKIKKYV